ncbi:MAG: hypothetical protein M3133_10180, partial [Actinomycetota bacterium]|nr:hypothetical protein [Actinomycetota bacterium]
MPEVGLCDEVRRSCAEIARSARAVHIDLRRLHETVSQWRGEGVESSRPALDPEHHYLEGDREEVCAYLLTLDAINFGSGWFPTIRKRPGCSGYVTIAWALADRFRQAGPWSAADLRRLDAQEVARVLGQDPG